jgi:hypothetical protein
VNNNNDSKENNATSTTEPSSKKTGGKKTTAESKTSKKQNPNKSVITTNNNKDLILQTRVGNSNRLQKENNNIAIENEAHIDQEIVKLTQSESALCSTVDDSKSTKVKSPDYSFVNLAIQPRKTLNLLQRNLSITDTTSLRLDAIENNVNFIAENSLQNHQQQQQQQQMTPNSSEDSSTKLFFNPKKHWLKSCVTTTSTSESTSSPVSFVEVKSEELGSCSPQPSSGNEVAQPPKKRRLLIFDEQSVKNEPSMQQSIYY